MITRQEFIENIQYQLPECNEIFAVDLELRKDGFFMHPYIEFVYQLLNGESHDNA